MTAPRVLQSDVLIAGGGIIGLSLALELYNRGAQVTVVERDTAMSHASTAAAGMLAAEDPYNPPEITLLARFSTEIYPEMLARIESLSGIVVPFQTGATVQYLSGGSSILLAEHSLDPRQLAAALLAAVRATSIDLRQHTGNLELADTPEAIHVRDATGTEFAAPQFVHCTGTWFRGQNAVSPRKGQMLRVQLPSPLTEVHRAEHIYIVPRTLGPQAGSALIGATIEDAGFDTTTHPADLANLRARAAELLPELASESDAPQLEAWAGLRPFTPDGLPLLGILSPREFVATGHFRNGILLAPATARVMADLLENKSPTIDLTPFSPNRYNQTGT
ncbi:MAG TPA: FAD-dependent oxidoreductase [Acidobacteriaceae bacterium]|nr:FAD-dependent oxidoreductase [Acidobacteriaceae bacterium]